MSQEIITISAQDARRLAVIKQHLSGKLPARATREHILSVVRDMVFVQWDPIGVVAPSHLLTLWNRVGDFRLSDLESLLWEDKKLFESWTNFAAGIVATEDYPLFYSLMTRYPESIGKSWGSRKPKTRKFLAEHKGLARSMLNQLKKRSLQLTEFREYVPTKRVDGWISGSEVSEILFHLHMRGKIMVVGHQGNRNIWGLAEEFLPNWVKRTKMSEKEVERMSAQRAIRALGTASPVEINYYFPRGRYQDLKGALKSLQDDSVIHRVAVRELKGKDERYVHDLDVKLLESMNEDSWEPRVSLLPPFDNLICGRGRTNRIFGFDYSHEMFLPEAKRKYGYYVLPILWGDSLVGRIDPKLEKNNKRLMIKSVHSEPGATREVGVAAKIDATIRRLAGFLGAEDVVYSPHVPPEWRSSLR